MAFISLALPEYIEDLEFISFCQIIGLNEIFGLFSVSYLGLVLVLSCTLHAPSWAWSVLYLHLRWCWALLPLQWVFYMDFRRNVLYFT